MRFSERMGFQKPKSEFQKESMDFSLRVGIWNCITLDILDHLEDYSMYEDNIAYGDMEHLIERFWLDFFNAPIDKRPMQKRTFVEGIRKWFFEADWYMVYEVFC